MSAAAPFLIATVVDTLAIVGGLGAGLIDLWLTLLVIAIVIAGSILIFRYLWVRNQHEDDRSKIRDALDRIGNGDLSVARPDLATRNYEMLGDALDRALETTRSRISDLEWSSDHDLLTGLLNSASFKRRCQEFLTHDDNADRCGTLLYLDVNEFKQVNDSLGHEAGDKLLVACADRLKMAVSFENHGKLAAIASHDNVEDFTPLVARLGGDEFAIFLPGIQDRAKVERAIQRIQRLIAEPCHVTAHSLRTPASIGAAMSSDHHNVYERLLSAADTAMYEAKSAGKGGHRFYDELMRNKADRILERELELTAALDSGQFSLHFQPQLMIATNQIIGAEALIRWEHPERGTIMPGDFIPFAETYGLIDQIGDWVLREAVKTAARWWQSGRQITIAVNISPDQLNRVELIPTIRACLSKYQLPPHALEIEITEAAVMRNDPIALDRLQSLRQDGVNLALDDFGTGYSNLAKLLEMPLDRLKLDRSLLWAASSQARSRAVLLSLIQLARRLDFEVVAEGVETQQQMEFLIASRCHVAQGYLIARPLPEEDFLALIDEAEMARKSSEAA